MGRPKKREIRSCAYSECTTEFECIPSSSKKYCSKSCAMADPAVKAKLVKSLEKKFETTGFPMQREEVRKKHHEKMVALYGKSYRKLNHKKASDTMQDRYGVSSPFVSGSEFRKKARKTKLKLYGSETYNGSKKRRTTKYTDILTEWDHLTPMFSESDFMDNGVVDTVYDFKCTSCNSTVSACINNGYIPHCRNCSNKVKKYTSDAEREILEYLSTELKIENINQNDRTILKDGRELDLVLPDHLIAIEYNGIYWHSDEHKPKSYHIKKTKLATMEGYQLIHLFDYQWKHKSEIVKSLLASKLGKSKTRIYARKCEIKKVSPADKKEFLNRCHLQGNCNSSVNLGLYYDGQLVCLTTFNKSRYDKTYDFELTRMASELHTTVVGGFSKLLKAFISQYNPKTILSYADRAISVGNAYYKNGFILAGVTPPNYFYFKDLVVESREKYQKHKLKDILPSFDPSKTEYENMRENGYRRFWDCGNYKFYYTPTKKG